MKRSKAYWLRLKEDVPYNDYWDYAILYELLPVQEYEFAPADKLSKTDKAVVVFPARHHIDMVDQLNKELSKVKKVVLFLMGDEEHLFPVEEIKHDDIQIWIQNPEQGRHDDYHKLGTGFTPHVDVLGGEEYEKTLDVFFSGQITHTRRKEMWEVLLQMEQRPISIDVNATRSFTAGHDSADYIKRMAKAKVAPAPSGPKTQDSFRFFEALECMAIPLADDIHPKSGKDGYWEWLFDDAAFYPLVKDWRSAPGYTADMMVEYDRRVQMITSWWLMKKRQYRKEIQKFLDIESDNITVVVPSSPIRAHPSTDIIDETIASIRHHLPNSEIIITLDGIRSEQADLNDQYNEYKNKVLWRALHHWHNVVVLVHEEHQHQSGMMHDVMQYIETPLILYVEHDTPLVTDKEIDFDACIDFINEGEANTVRFHFENVIPDAHKGLVMDQDGDFLQTFQWSQRPLLSTRAYFKTIMSRFPIEARCFIEDVWHGVVMNDWYEDGILGWNKHRLWIYHPEGGIQRSYNLDGRGEEDKYEQKFE